MGAAINVDPSHIAWTGVIPRMIRLTRTQRPPTDPAGGECRPGAHTEEGHQGRRIDRIRRRLRFDRHAGRPGPASADVRPTAVMERREPPGRVVDPGPAPGGYIGPVPFPVWRPAGGHLRIPDRAIVGRRVPGAVAGKVLAARHPCHHGRDHGCGRRRALAGEHRADERIALRRADRTLHRRRAGDRGGLLRADVQRDALSRHLRRTPQDRDQRGIIRVAGGDRVAARRGDRHRRARRLQHIAFARRQTAQMEIHVALRLGCLHRRRVQRADIEFGAARHGDSRPGKLDLGLRAGLGPERVARRDGVVSCRRTPLRGVLRVERDGAADPGEAAHAGRRVGSLWAYGLLVGRLLVRRHRLRACRPRPRGAEHKPRRHRGGGGKAKAVTVCAHLTLRVSGTASIGDQDGETATHRPQVCLQFPRRARLLVRRTVRRGPLRSPTAPADPPRKISP